MKRHILFLLALLLSLSSSYGQSIITGHVRTLQGAPVEYARVLALVPTDSTILAYTFTDALGGYRLSVSSTQPQLLISVASMEIERIDRRVEKRQPDLRLPSQGVTHPPKRGTGEGA